MTMSIILCNRSAFSTYRFAWTAGDGAEMEVQWGDGMTNPLAFRHGFPAEVRNPERFGFDPAKANKGGRSGTLHFKAFTQRFAEELEAWGGGDDHGDEQARDAVLSERA